MKFSVIINTYNRARSLRNTLMSLRCQTYTNFEVVVVNGPSTDDTEVLLAEFGSDLRAVKCPEVNLSLSRNIGIAAAAGDVVAFIDDDAEADPLWLQQLAEAYDSPRIGGVGGLVYDYTGVRFQYEYSVCDRKGNADFSVRPPLWGFMHPVGDKFVYLQGTNCSFRREYLMEIGGFNEEFEYFLDETEVCMRLIDHGYWLKSLPHAFVYHRFLASHLRNHEKVLREPFQVMKNRVIFAIQSMRPQDSLREVIADCAKFSEHLIKDARFHHEAGRLSAVEFTKFNESVDRALRLGLDRGLNGQRRSAKLPAIDHSAFRAFPTLETVGPRMTVVFISQEIPPGCGGIGQFTWDLAVAFASAGHEIHLITRSPDQNRVDFQDGLWIHRIVLLTEGDWKRPEMPAIVAKNLSWAAAAHEEARRITATRPVDVVSAPVWDTEGIFCQLDPGLNTVLTLHTTLRTVVDMNPSWRSSPGMAELLALEEEVIRSARCVTSPSRATLNKVRHDTGALGKDVKAYPIHHGVPDRSHRFSPRQPDGRVRVLTVGRVEKRKGPDLLLAAAVTLLPEFPELEIVFVGNDSIVAEGSDQTYRRQFEQKYGQMPFADRVKFAGLVSETELQRAYAECDIFCLPARYESFGLVLIEAMSFGKPVIAAAVGGMSEIVQDEQNGLLVYPEHVPSLTLALRRLVKDAAERNRMGKVSRQIYEEQFTDEKMLQRTLAVYREFAGLPNHTRPFVLPFSTRRAA